MSTFSQIDVDVVELAIRELDNLPDAHKLVARLQVLATKLLEDLHGDEEHEFGYWRDRASTALGAASWSPDLEEMLPDAVASAREAFAHAHTDEQIILVLGMLRTAIEMRTMMRAKHLARTRRG